jgi:hypothetical protein
MPLDDLKRIKPIAQIAEEQSFVIKGTNVTLGKVEEAPSPPGSVLECLLQAPLAFVI